MANVVSNPEGMSELVQKNNIPSGLQRQSSRIYNYSTCFDRLNTPPSELIPRKQ
jgi:hypothetical protein